MRLAPIGPSASLVERFSAKPERTERLLVCRSSFRSALYSNLSVAARSLCLNDLNGLVELEG